jgi:hypothetical protein
MELFIKQDSADLISLALELFAVYVRASQRNIVTLNSMSASALNSIKLQHVPLLIKTTSDIVDGKEVHLQSSTGSPYTIMQEIASACYLEDVIFGKKDSIQRLEISTLLEQAQRLSAAELTEMVNTHIGQSRMFLVGLNVTVADIVVFAHIAHHFSALPDFEKIQLPHAFRWLDHI